MAERRRRSSGFSRALRGDAPPAAALALYAPLAAMAAIAAVFLAGGVGALDPDLARNALLWLGAILLAFLAGVRFGRGIAGSPRLLLLAAVPPLAGWAALLLPAAVALAVLALAHAAQGMWDVWSADGIRLPAWYAGLRARTAPITVVLLAAVLLAGAF